jgi:hypothetical protein
VYIVVPADVLHRVKRPLTVHEVASTGWSTRRCGAPFNGDHVIDKHRASRAAPIRVNSECFGARRFQLWRPAGMPRDNRHRSGSPSHLPGELELARPDSVDVTSWGPAHASLPTAAKSARVHSSDGMHPGGVVGGGNGRRARTPPGAAVHVSRSPREAWDELPMQPLEAGAQGGQRQGPVEKPRTAAALQRSASQDEQAAGAGCCDDGGRRNWKWWALALLLLLLAGGGAGVAVFAGEGNTSGRLEAGCGFTGYPTSCVQAN